MIQVLEEVNLNCLLCEEAGTHCSVNSGAMHKHLFEQLKVSKVIICKSSTKMQVPGPRPVWDTVSDRMSQVLEALSWSVSHTLGKVSKLMSSRSERKGSTAPLP